MIFIWGFFLSVWWVWETPKIEKWRSVLSAGAPFFRCVATPDVLANQQVTPVWQAPLFCKCTYNCCACYSLKSQSPAPLQCVFYASTNTFFAVNLDSNTRS